MRRLGRFEFTHLQCMCCVFSVKQRKNVCNMMYCLYDYFQPNDQHSAHLAVQSLQ